MMSDFTFEKPIKNCREAWVKPELLNQWLTEAAARNGDDLCLTSRLPNISGRHQLLEENDDRLLFDWYIEGHKTRLELQFEESKGKTNLSLKHDWGKRVPESIMFPPGKHYGDQVWEFAISNLRCYLDSGTKAIELPLPYDPGTVELGITIRSTSDAIWDALTKIDQLKSWNNLVMENGLIESKAGGRYSFGWEEEAGDDGDGPDHITVWKPGSHLAYGWFGGRDSTIHWKLEKVDKSSITIRFLHTGLKCYPQDAWSYKMGWAHALFELKWYLEKGEETGSFLPAG